MALSGMFGQERFLIRLPERTIGGLAHDGDPFGPIEKDSNSGCSLGSKITKGPRKIRIPPSSSNTKLQSKNTIRQKKPSPLRKQGSSFFLSIDPVIPGFLLP
jgi:hypothetical protein